MAVAASAGGLKALSRLFAALPADFPAALVVVQHLDPGHPSVMADILARRTRLAVKQAANGERLKVGTAYLAPPDRHLLVTPDGSVSLTDTDRVHFVRPSADLLFESVAAVFGTGAIAVVLTGTGSDGSQGVTAVKRAGGAVIAQDASAEFPGMPGAAIATGCVDFVLALDEIPAALRALLRTGTAS